MKTLLTILAAVGVLAVLYALANWNTLFPPAIVRLNQTNGERLVALREEEDENPISSNGRTICKVTKPDGTVVEITGHESDADFIELCRKAQSRDYQTPIYWHNNVYYPWVWVRPRPPYHTSTGTGTGTSTGTGTGIGTGTGTGTGMGT